MKLRVTAVPVLARQIAQVCHFDKNIGMMPVNDIGASTISLRGRTLERETSYIALSDPLVPKLVK